MEVQRAAKPTTRSSAEEVGVEHAIRGVGLENEDQRKIVRNRNTTKDMILTS